MREILKYPQMDKQKLETVKNLIDCIAEKVNDDCISELEELSSVTGKHHELMEFAQYWEWTDLDTLAAKTLVSEPPCVRDLSKKEIEEIISITKNYLIYGEEAKADYYIELLHKSLPLTNVMDYIMSEESEEKIAERMLAAAKTSVIIL